MKIPLPEIVVKNTCNLSIVFKNCMVFQMRNGYIEKRLKIFVDLKCEIVIGNKIKSLQNFRPFFLNGSWIPIFHLASFDLEWAYVEFSTLLSWGYSVSFVMTWALRSSNRSTWWNSWSLKDDLQRCDRWWRWCRKKLKFSKN